MLTVFDDEADLLEAVPPGQQQQAMAERLSEQKRKVVQTPEEVLDVTIGNDLCLLSSAI